MVSVGGILTKIPSRIVKRTETKVTMPNASTSTTPPIPDPSIKPQSPYSWDDTQHPMYSHPNFETYRQAAMINGINPSTVHYIPSIIQGIPAPIKSQPEEGHTTISIGGLLTKIPTSMAKVAEKVEVSASNESVKKEAYPMPTMPITQSLINRGTVPGKKTNSTPSRDTAKLIPTIANALVMKDGFAAAAAATFTPAFNDSNGERSDLMWEREQERQKKGKEAECWSDDEDWVGLQAGLPVESKNAPLQIHAKEEERAEAKVCYENNEDSLGFQSGSHLRPVSSIHDKNTPKSNGWTLGQDIEADEISAPYVTVCDAVHPDVVLASLCEDSSPVPPEGTMERYGRILRSIPGDEKKKTRALMESLENLIPSTLRQDSWYLAAIGALIGSQQSELVGDLYTYLCEKKEYQTSAQRQKLVKRMREGLLKLIPIVGMPLITRAFKALVSVEASSDRDTTTSWSTRQLTPERLEKARNSMKTSLQPEELQTMYASFGSHRDLAWVTENIVYGLFLSDTSVLSAADTELVVFSALLCTGRNPLAEAHMRGALGLGMSVEDVDGVQAICAMLSGWKSTEMGLKRARM